MRRDLPFERAFRDWARRAGVSWEESRLALAGPGHSTMAIRLSPRERPRRVVIALHGAGNDALFGWVGLFKRLLATGTEICTFDLPGHGRDGETLFDRRAAAAAVLASIAECVRGRESLPLHAVGVSLGGSVLLSMLDHLQSRLASATLIVPPLRINLSLRSLLPELGLRTLRLVWREREHYGLTGLIPSFGPFKRDVYPLRLATMGSGPFGYVDVLNRELEAMRLDEVAARVPLPVLLVFGERDRVVPIEQGYRLAELLGDAELLRVADGTHLSTPLEPETVDRLVAWLEARG